MFKKVLIFALVFVLAFSCMIPCAFAAELNSDDLPNLPTSPYDNTIRLLLYFDGTYTLYYLNEDYGPYYFKVQSPGTGGERLLLFEESVKDNYGYFTYYNYNPSYPNNGWTVNVENQIINSYVAVKAASGNITFVGSDLDIVDYNSGEVFFSPIQSQFPMNLMELVRVTLVEEMKGLMGQTMILVIAGVCCLACLICLPLLKKVLNRFL